MHTPSFPVLQSAQRTCRAPLWRPVSTVLAVACLATLAGCAGPALQSTQSPSTQSAAVVPAAAWPERLQQWLPADVLLLGEQHDAPDHQRLQREAVAWLASRSQLAALVMEMAERGHSTQGLPRDASEAQAIAAVFGAYKPLVSSTKSMTGHECWMAGASEIVYSLLMMHNNFVAPNINFENPDEHSARLNIAATTKEKKIDVFLSNSFGFGGTNSSLVVRKWAL